MKYVRLVLFAVVISFGIWVTLVIPWTSTGTFLGVGHQTWLLVVVPIVVVLIVRAIGDRLSLKKTAEIRIEADSQVMATDVPPEVLQAAIETLRRGEAAEENEDIDVVGEVEVDPGHARWGISLEAAEGELERPDEEDANQEIASAMDEDKNGVSVQVKESQQPKQERISVVEDAKFDGGEVGDIVGIEGGSEDNAEDLSIDVGRRAEFTRTKVGDIVGRKQETDATEAAYAATGSAYEAAEGFVEIPVYYITDRTPTGKPDPNRFYKGTWREGPLDRGVVKVSIPLPPVHKVGHVERPSLKKLQLRENPKLHVCLLGIDTYSEEEFKTEVRTALSEADERSVLLFVHGYNVSFAEAARRAAQVKYDLDFGGISLLYSWPSKRKTFLYSHDEQNIRLSLQSFKEELAALLTIDTPRPIVHIVAHSMGNRLVVPAVADLGADEKRLLNQVVFAAPDMDAREFKQFAERFHKVAEQFTLYANRLDMPLWFSKGIHGGRRAGISGDGIVVFDGIDTVDASNVDTSLMGHSTFSDDRNVIRDIEMLLKEGLPPARRGGLIPQGPDDERYWTFRP